MNTLRHLSPAELYEIELAARRARDAELARLMRLGGRALKALIVRLVSSPASEGKGVRHA
jgi:hypothetical protein